MSLQKSNKEQPDIQPSGDAAAGAADKMEKLKEDVEVDQAKKAELAKKIDAAVEERVNILESTNELKVKEFCDSLAMRTKGAVMVFLNPEHQFWKEMVEQTHAFREQLSNVPTEEQAKNAQRDLAEQTISLARHAAAETDESLENEIETQAA